MPDEKHIIVVADFGGRYLEARVKGRPDITFVSGDSVKLVVGTLITQHPELFGITVDVRTDPFLED